MARDALAVLWRVRDAAVTEASRALAQARLGESQAAQDLDDQMRDVARETTAMGTAHILAFVAWRTQARRQTDMLRAALLRAQAEAAALQQSLAMRRTDAEAVAKARARVARDAALTETRCAQAAMDEAAGERFAAS
jgi:hypothetical protein